MAKADDSSLDPEQLSAVQLAARRALDRATGWGVFPTPIPDILEAAKLKIAPASAFDPRRIVEYLMGKAEHAAEALKSAISKVFGIYDADESLIHITTRCMNQNRTFLSCTKPDTTSFPRTASCTASSRIVKRPLLRKSPIFSSARQIISLALFSFRATATEIWRRTKNLRSKRR